jgi:hypothetical protein
MNAQLCLLIYSTMTMQVKEERVDTDYHRSGQHVAGSQPQQYAQQQQLSFQTLHHSEPGLSHLKVCIRVE